VITRGVASATVVLSLLALVTACGDDDAGGSTETRVVEVTIEGDTVTPEGERISVDVNQPVDIVVTSDVAGELHVHSSPETTAPFEEGENDPIELQFDRAGLVDVELHEPFEGPVVQLEVS
jgi:hypothetical protein